MAEEVPLPAKLARSEETLLPAKPRRWLAGVQESVSRVVPFGAVVGFEGEVVTVLKMLRTKAGRGAGSGRKNGKKRAFILRY